MEKLSSEVICPKSWSKSVLKQEEELGDPGKVTAELVSTVLRTEP